MITSINEWNLYKKTKPNTPDPINVTAMGPNDIFVFGSNTEGKHGGGAAKAAMNFYGAIWGQARGLQGNSYAIVTLDYSGQEPITTKEIEQEIIQYFEFAKAHPELKFWTTKIGCSIAGFHINEIAKLFDNKVIPDNVFLPIEFT